jgi:hypothetical protein
MDKKKMKKRRSTSLVTKETQIKIIMRYHFTAKRMTIRKKGRY